MASLLSKDHPITEKAVMEFRPFGKETDGTPIRDMGGIVTRANVEHLEDVVAQKHGKAAGRAAVEELVAALNARIPDRAYHVTARFLCNPWNSYATEFQAYMGRFCMDISGEPRFHFNMAKEKAITPIIQVLGRPFSVSQIYRMSAYFCQRYAKDSFLVEAVSISQQSAVLRMTFSERMCRHLGPYRRACAVQWCDGVRGYFCGVPEQFHHLAPATVTDLSCIADGDEECRWEVAWSEPTRRGKLWHIPLARHVVQTEVVQPEIDDQERIMAEQVRVLDTRHLELQESPLQQQHIAADRPRRPPRRLLVIDNDRDIGDFLTDRLQSLGYAVRTVMDGATAVQVVRSEVFDGIILDIGIQGIDGLEVLRQVRQRDRAVPIIMITASGAKERAIQAINMGAQAYLFKPFDAAVITQIVQQWLGHASCPT